jgi:hypothetical protein
LDTGAHPASFFKFSDRFFGNRRVPAHALAFEGKIFARICLDGKNQAVQGTKPIILGKIFKFLGFKNIQGIHPIVTHFALYEPIHNFGNANEQ